MTFNRLIYSTLEEWSHDPARKPLIVRGARQVGKTTAIREFAQQRYKNRIILNLEKPAHRAFFIDHADARVLVEVLLLSHNLTPDQIPHTLLFIDEIQEVPEAIAMLRYFYEDVPGLAVIAAGSLLEHVMGRVKNFPVGRVNFLHMHPLNFPEYLQAKGLDTALATLQQTPIPDFAHPTLINLFHEYAITGGMPEVVQTFIQKGSIAALPQVYESIWETYKEDIEKYADGPAQAKVLRHIINTAHLYVDQRIKFENFGKSRYRSREVGEAFRSLDEARVIQLIYPATEVTPPLRPDLRKSPRLQFLDTGLLNHALNIQAQMLGMDDLSTAYKGAIIPALIMQEWLSLQTKSYHKPLFWVREKTQSSAEVDLVLTQEGKTIPIEIKSGTTGTLRSLHQFVDMVDHPYAVRMYAGPWKVERHTTPLGDKPYLLLNLPYYLGTRLSECIDHFMSHHTI